MLGFRSCATPVGTSRRGTLYYGILSIFLSVSVNLFTYVLNLFTYVRINLTVSIITEQHIRFDLSFQVSDGLGIPALRVNTETFVVQGACTTFARPVFGIFLSDLALGPAPLDQKDKCGELETHSDKVQMSRESPQQLSASTRTS